MEKKKTDDTLLPKMDLSQFKKLPELGDELAPKYPFKGFISYLVFAVLMLLVAGPWLVTAKVLVVYAHAKYAQVVLAFGITLSFLVCRRVMMYYMLALQRKAMIDALTVQLFADPEFFKVLMDKMNHPEREKATMERNIRKKEEEEFDRKKAEKEGRVYTPAQEEET